MRFDHKKKTIYIIFIFRIISLLILYREVNGSYLTEGVRDEFGKVARGTPTSLTFS